MHFHQIQINMQISAWSMSDNLDNNHIHMNKTLQNILSTHIIIITEMYKNIFYPLIRD